MILMFILLRFVFSSETEINKQESQTATATTQKHGVAKASNRTKGGRRAITRLNRGRGHFTTRCRRDPVPLVHRQIFVNISGAIPLWTRHGCPPA